MISQLSINALIDLVIGETDITPRQTGPQLISWFNRYGFNDNYTNGLPPENVSRRVYAKSRVERINEEFDMKSFLESLVDSRRFPPNSQLLINQAAEAVNAIIAHDDLVLNNVNGVYKLFTLDGTGEVGVTAVFEDIQQVLLNEIRQAEFMIWVAVAWFTDRTLCLALESKKKQGVDVKVIVVDDEINRDSGINYEAILNGRRVQPVGYYGNLMHHKFVIFDLKKVIHGSYNWTTRARYNNESISLTHGRAFAEEFARQFVRLSAEE